MSYVLIAAFKLTMVVVCGVLFPLLTLLLPIVGPVTDSMEKDWYSLTRAKQK